MATVKAVLIDIDGVLTVSWRALPGAVAAMARLRRTGLGLRLVTNTTSRTRAWMATRLSAQGFPVHPEDILTAPGLTAHYLLDNLATRHPRSLKVAALLEKPARARVHVPIDFKGFTIEDKFVVGYGLDYAEQYRNLPYIGVLG